jgi:alpha/beta superfamily hydrolase
MAEHDGGREIAIGPGGHVRALLWDAPAPSAGVVLVGGAGGGVDTPAEGLFPRLGRHLSGDGTAVLQVEFRLPGELGEADLDAAAGIRFLAQRGCGQLAIVGHSFGGAVAIRVAAALREVDAVVALSTQSHGTERVGALVGRPLLLVHGTDDEVLPPDCSVAVFRGAGEPKELRLLPGTGHALAEQADEVYRIVHGFLAQHLLEPAAARPAPP